MNESMNPGRASCNFELRVVFTCEHSILRHMKRGTLCLLTALVTGFTFAADAEMKDNPIIELNRAVILSMTQGPEAAIRKLLVLEEHPRLKGYYLLHATLGDLYQKLGQAGKAREYLTRAAGMTTSKTEIHFLMEKMGPCKE